MENTFAKDLLMDLKKNHEIFKQSIGSIRAKWLRDKLPYRTDSSDDGTNC